MKGRTLLLVVFVAGCGPKASFLKSAPPEPLERGWHLISQPTEGFSIAIPPDWSEVDVTNFDPDRFDPAGLDPQKILSGKSDAAADPRAYLVTTLVKPRGTQTLYAMKGDFIAGQALTLSKETEKNCDPEANAKIVEARARRRPFFNDVTEEKVELPCGTAYRVRAEASAPGRSTYRAIYTHYFLADGDTLYEAIFLSAGTGDIAPTRKIMRTFRVQKLAHRN